LRLACFNVIHHRTEDRASRLPGRLRLDEFSGDAKMPLLRKLPELGELRVDG